MKDSLFRKIQRKADSLGITTADYIGCIFFSVIGGLVVVGGVVFLILSRSI